MLSRLQIFSFDEIWDVSIILITLFMAVLYLLITGPLRKYFSDTERVPLYKKILFLFGLSVFYLAEGPLDLMGHLMFSAHMLKQALLYLVMPPLLYLGSPKWFFQPLLKFPSLTKVIRFVTNPVLSVLLFNGLFSLYHMPMIFDSVMVNFAYYNIYHDLLLISAFIMWWPFFCPIKELNPISHLKKLALLLANSFVLTPACALIIFAGEPMYQTYTDPNMWAQALSFCLPAGSTLNLTGISGPQLFSMFTPLHDQQLGGVIMKLVQEIVNGTMLTYILVQWIKREKAKEKVESELLGGSGLMYTATTAGQNNA